MTGKYAEYSVYFLVFRGLCPVFFRDSGTRSLFCQVGSLYADLSGAAAGCLIVAPLLRIIASRRSA